MEQQNIERKVIYSIWNEEKPAEKGYSKELYNVDLPRELWDQPENLPAYLDKPYKTITEAFEQQVQKHRDEDWLGTRVKNPDGSFGHYEWQTWGQIHDKVKALANGIKALDLCPVLDQVKEDGKEWRTCGLWAKNRWEWNTTMLAFMACRATLIGFYDAMAINQIEYITDQTELATIFMTPNYLSKVIEMRKQNKIQTLKTVVLYEPPSKEDQEALESLGIKVFSFEQVMEKGRETTEPADWKQVDPDDRIILFYTSGTTGDPKGAKTTHHSLLSNSILSEGCLFNEDDTYLSYLPAAHAFECWLFVSAIVAGSKLGYFSGDPTKITDDCQALRPTFFPSVPRLFNKIYAKIDADFRALTGVKGWLAQRGLAAKTYNLLNKVQYTSCCYDSFVFNGFNAVLGGRVRKIISASAPISGDVVTFLKVVFACPFIEAYGMSETSGGNVWSRVEDPVSGHAGGPNLTLACKLKDIPELEYMSSDKPFPRGELCMKGPMIMKGYFKKPEKTAECLINGWMHSGDVVEVYPNGTIKIIDRTKNIFKLAQGEYLAPEKLENGYIQSPLIAQIIVYGDMYRSCCVAIVVPDDAALTNWCQANGKTKADVFADQTEYSKLVIESMVEVAKEKNFNSLERPKAIYLTSEAFSPENEILTPTFKMKRNVGAKVYKKQIEDMYEKLKEIGF